MREPAPDTILVPCLACKKSVVLPGGKVRAAMRAGRPYVTFCSRRCNMRYVAMEGTKRQEELMKDA